jgi:protease-4
VKSFLRSFFAALAAIVAAVLILFGTIASRTGQQPKIEKNSWLVIDLYGEIHEYDLPGGVMSELVGGKTETLTRILSNMEMAAVDDRIEGVVFKMSSANGAGRAMMEEMRGAIGKVRESGKKVYGFSDSMDRHTYYLASACDKIFMPRTGYFIFNGMAAGSEHILGTLEKLGIKPQIHAIKDYKSAAEMITRKDMSPASRENKDWMLAEYWEMFCSTIGADRGFTEEQIVAMMEKVLFTPAEAVEAGLIDSLMYWDEIEEMLKPEGDEKFAALSQSRYAEEDAGKLGFKGKKKIAVIHAQGTIGGRSNRIDPMFGVMMGHESIVAEFKRAREDEDVAAIVFRVDSPGGESLASDLIGHQVEVTAKDKPVVVSMVDVAASGGYHISYRASKIVADPMTLTGSIGSISGKANVKGLFDKLGVTHDFTTKGPQALFYSEYTDFDEKQWKIFTDNHWADFNAWLRDVSEHRGMSFEEAEKLAHGRVWTGRQGKENGLVDETGGLDRAIAVARELAAIPEKDKVTVEHFPVKKSFVEELMSGGGFSAVAEYVVYRFIRADLAETWNMAQSRLYMMEPVDAR